MHFDIPISRLGIDYPAADNSYLVGEVANVKIVNRKMDFGIIRYESRWFDMIFVDKSTTSTRKYKWFDLDADYIRSGLANKDKLFGECPVLVVHNDKQFINIPIKDVDAFLTHVDEICKFFSNVLHASTGSFVYGPVSYDEMQAQVEEGINSVAGLYVPTHQGVPALWCTDQYAAKEMFDVTKRDFSTNEIAKWFSNEVKSHADSPVCNGLTNSKVCVDFFYNYSYQRYNGAISYNVLLYPVFVRFWEECVREGCLTEKGAYDNWSVWTSCGLDTPTRFMSQETVAEEEEVSVDARDLSIGKWVFRTKSPYQKAREPRTVSDTSVPALMSYFTMQAVVTPNYIPILTIYEPDTKTIITYEYAFKDGEKMLGNAGIVAEELISKLNDDGYGGKCVIIENY